MWIRKYRNWEKITTAAAQMVKLLSGPYLDVFGPMVRFAAQHLAFFCIYGLAGAVISEDLERCNRITEEIQAGIAWVNCSPPCFCQSPWGWKKRIWSETGRVRAGELHICQMKASSSL